MITIFIICIILSFILAIANFTQGYALKFDYKLYNIVSKKHQHSQILVYHIVHAKIKLVTYSNSDFKK